MSNDLYNVFDGFLDSSTWHTGHDTDNRYFYIALSKVVDIDGFNPDEMAEHMRESLDLDALEKNVKEHFSLRVNELKNAAWHIMYYRKTVSS